MDYFGFVVGLLLQLLAGEHAALLPLAFIAAFVRTASDLSAGAATAALGQILVQGEGDGFRLHFRCARADAFVDDRLHRGVRSRGLTIRPHLLQ